MNKSNDMEPERDELLPEDDFDALLNDANRGKFVGHRRVNADDDLKQQRRYVRFEQARRELNSGDAFTFEEVEAILKGDNLLP